MTILARFLSAIAAFGDLQSMTPPPPQEVARESLLALAKQERTDPRRMAAIAVVVGMEVHWTPNLKALVSPTAQEWSYVRWYQQIARAAAGYGVRLKVDHSTLWLVSSDLKAAILEAKDT